MIALYRNIKDLRLKLNMSQDELARKVGYKDRTSIAKIESGMVDLSQSKIELFAQALETTPAKLMGWTDESALLQDGEKPDIILFDNGKAYNPSKLPEEAQKELQTYIEFLHSKYLKED